MGFETWECYPSTDKVAPENATLPVASRLISTESVPAKFSCNTICIFCEQDTHNIVRSNQLEALIVEEWAWVDDTMN